MEIKIGSNVELCKAADELRRIVFIEEQGVPEDEIVDGLNFDATHIVLFDHHAPVATARALNQADGWHIGLVAVDQARRGQHLGESVMRAAIAYIASNGGKHIFLTAQQQVCVFYEKLGFVQCGEAIIFESGFVLIPMKLSL